MNKPTSIPVLKRSQNLMENTIQQLPSYTVSALLQQNASEESVDNPSPIVGGRQYLFESLTSDDSFNDSQTGECFSLILYTILRINKNLFMSITHFADIEFVMSISSKPEKLPSGKK